MTSDIKPTDQLAAWCGAFGDSYVDRNVASDEIMFSRTQMWSRILTPLNGAPPMTILEVGANIGLNLRALKKLTNARLIAIEPNEKACARLIEDGVVDQNDLHNGFAQNVPMPDGVADMTFTSGVLIHIAPEDLPAAMSEIYRLSSKYVMCCEYFSDHPEEINYRGHDGLLFKRDFGAYWLELYPDLELVDYGFFWKQVTGLDNLTWWLFRKG